MFAGRASTAVDHRLNSATFKKKVGQVMEDTVSQLYVIWKEAGYEEIECQGLLGDIFAKVKGLCASELDAEKKILEHAKAQVQVKLSEYFDYCQQLGRQSAARVATDANSNYTDKLAELENLINAISVEVRERSGLLNKEYSAAKELVERLGSEALVPIADFSGPAGTPQLSDVRLQLIKDYKNSAAKKVESKVVEMKQLSDDIYALLDEMSLLQAPHVKDEFMTAIISGPLNTYYELVKSNSIEVWRHKCHCNDEKQMKALLSQLTSEREHRRAELSQNGSEIARLWTLLRIPTAEREQFTNSFEMNLSTNTLLRGRQELIRLHTVRTTSLAKVINSIRSDILAIWKELLIDNERQQEDEFPLYFVPIASLGDSSVEEHEQYYLTIKERAEELRPIMQRISRREMIVQERLELEQILSNSERLTARGPNAREERKREEAMANRVKTLEKLTKEILTLIPIYEEKHGQFLFMGELYSTRIQEQEEAYLESRDLIRNARKKKDGKQETVAPLVSKTAPTPRRPTALSGASATLAGSLVAKPTKESSLSSSTSTSSSMASATTTPTTVFTTSLKEAENLGVGSYNYGGLVNISVADAAKEKDKGCYGHRDSECTAYTSATEVRDRESVATVVKGTH